MFELAHIYTCDYISANNIINIDCKITIPLNDSLNLNYIFIYIPTYQDTEHVCPTCGRKLK